jgi:hypothetical protein
MTHPQWRVGYGAVLFCCWVDLQNGAAKLDVAL